MLRTRELIFCIYTHLRVNRILCLFLFDFQILFLSSLGQFLKKWLITFMTHQNTDSLLAYTQWMKINKILPAEFSLPFSTFFQFTKLKKNLTTQSSNFRKMKKCSATGNRTPVSRVTGGDTHHYTIVETSESLLKAFII